jgi:hypothetical protein
MGTLSATISVKAEKEKIFKRYFDEDYDTYLYGLKDWFDEEGKVKSQYLPTYTGNAGFSEMM